MKTKSKIAKALLCVLIILLTCGVQLALTKQTGIQNKSEDMRPPLFDTPSYVEIKNGGTLTAKLTADRSCNIGSLSVVMVNTDSEGKGEIEFVLTNNEGGEEWTTTVPEASITVGEWYEIGSPATYVEEGKEYTLAITANNCNPYFIKTQIDATNRSLPFEEQIFAADEASGADGNVNADSISRNSDSGALLSTGISLGTSVISDKPLTYGDVFYYSHIITILIAAAAILFIIFGYEKCTNAIKTIHASDLIMKAGNDIFLVVLFIVLCLSIYINGYLEGINISADSAGYLREAANMAAGYGFNYDGLAGYKGAWFANWPILYPAMIAAVMKITGLEVYAASKILSMIFVGILILILRIAYNKEAWFYALFMTNLGLMYLYWYSWSELPFILFMVLFAFSLADVLADGKNYILLGASAFLCFLTRYFGMFTYFVIGFYILALAITAIRDEKTIKAIFNKKIISLVITAGVSGILCVAYLFNNKLQNGMPSGVSRSMWWDDYQSLTNDLVKSLFAEVFNLFHLEVPQYIMNLSYGKSVLILFLLGILIAAFIAKNCKHFTRESVLITTAVIYYVMFTVIRYFSSMDTFYYRFFAPATFLFTLGIAGLLIKYIRDTKIYIYLLSAMILYLLIFAASDYTEHVAKNTLPYYDIVKMSWDEDYAEIPENSVVIFSTLDYRSLYYRSDVVEGTIDPSDTMDSIKSRYYGSSQMCILSSDAAAMREADIYDDSINDAIDENLDLTKKYLVINF
ncbi:ArnT family glycosyltransferase [Butyrivibrio sp. WCD3002]|uniref:ArnT family glycosyltransferase n=1 Tax=Butyrivibrio sp. WCD3002 TaxID=1280676 RepID=UPI0004101ADF|nr:hypothetical protein [Butyrivibrio sp. WCD3002]